MEGGGDRVCRPKAEETEDDLLRFQQEFLAAQRKPAATVIKPAKRKSGEQNNAGPTTAVEKDVVKMEVLPTTPPVVESVPPSKKSRFRTSQETVSSAKAPADMAENPEEALEKHDRHMAAVLTKIIERDTRNASVMLPRQTKQAFPSALHRGTVDKEAVTGPKKKRSLFAQQFMHTTPSEFGVTATNLDTTTQTSAGGATAGTPDSPKVIQGTGLSATFGRDEVKKIHQENLNRLAAMSEEEILSEQRKLLQMLDPKLVSFLKSQNRTAEGEEDAPLFTAADRFASKDSPHQSSQRAKQKDTEPDLPLKPKKGWVHMDNVEWDKLEWTKDLPLPTAGDSTTGQQARFDFHGNLVPVDANVPVNVGLHHHGDEPERAGYTLEELFQLARSTNLQQRALSLTTLSRIMHKAKMGALEEVVQTPLIPSLMKAGVIFLLRWALDENVESVIVAAVAALHAILTNPGDEVSLDRVFPWFCGHVISDQCPVAKESPSPSPLSMEDEKPEETDADIVRDDVILGLVTRMSLLPRLRYILEMYRPPATTVVQILDVLTRVARHSAGMAHQILQCPRLLDLIYKEFLPTSWDPVEPSQPLSVAFGIPLPSALKLMRTLSQCGRNMAAILLSRYSLQSRLMRYLVDPVIENLHLLETEGCNLQKESWRTWRVCLLYGLASDIFIDLFPAIVENLKALNNAVPTSSDRILDDRLAAMVTALEAVVQVAGSASRNTTFARREDGSSMEMESSTDVAMPTLNWTHVADIIQPVLVAFQTYMKHIQNSYQFKKHDLQIGTACINFLASYFSQWPSQPGYDALACLQQIEDICHSVIVPCWKSFGCQLILRELSNHSNLLSPPETVRRETAESLPELGCSATEDDQLFPVLRTLTPYGFLTALFRLVLEFHKIHKGLQKQVLDVIICDKDLLIYIKKVSAGHSSCLHSNHFTKFENLVQYFFLKIVYSCQQSKEPDLELNFPDLHRLTLHLLTRIHYGNEFLIHDLLSTIVFNKAFWEPPKSEEKTAQEKMAELRLSDSTHLRSATQQEIHVTHSQLVEDALCHLTNLRATYLQAFRKSEKAVIMSRNNFDMNVFASNTFLTSHTGECLLPKDWMYLPIIELYNTFSSVGSDAQNVLSNSQVETITNVLRWNFLLESQRADIISSISITLKISRIMCTFLTGNDLFLEKWVHCYLAALLREYTKPALLHQMNFEERIPGMASFYDLYIDLLQQYEAVSFGDSLFGCYVLVPLQQQHNFMLRKAVWTEYCGILRTLSIPVQELLIPIHRYLDPEEENVELLRPFFQCLLSQTVRPKWAPVMYLVAIHHVNRFMYTQTDKHGKLRTAMLQQAVQCKHEELRQHLLYYKAADVNKEFGMDLYSELPPIRKKLIDSLSSHQIT